MSQFGRVQSAQVRGGKTYQQDVVLYGERRTQTGELLQLLGVFDGHGGVEVAHHCASRTLEVFNWDAPSIATELNRVIGLLAKETNDAYAGTTCSLVCINLTRMTATTAFLGDSPIAHDNGADQVWVTNDHNVKTNLSERRWVEQRGGVYQWGYVWNAPDNDYGAPTDCYLELSRSLGDAQFARILDRTPVIEEHTLMPESVIVVASDGILAGHVRRSKDEVLADIFALVREECEVVDILQVLGGNHLEDNASLMVWTMDAGPPEAS